MKCKRRATKSTNTKRPNESWKAESTHGKLVECAKVMTTVFPLAFGEIFFSYACQHLNGPEHSRGKVLKTKIVREISMQIIQCRNVRKNTNAHIWLAVNINSTAHTPAYASDSWSICAWVCRYVCVIGVLL